MREGFLQATVGFEQFVRAVAVCHVSFQFVQAGLALLQVGEDGQHFCIDGVGAVGKGLHCFLAQIAQSPAAGNMDLAGCGFVDFRQEQQERGLPNAIGADQPDLAIVGDGDSDPAE
jgi:hypothetical protein